jgi:TonB family protein
MAALKLHAQVDGGTVSGTVMDPSGAVVPRCRVTVRSLGQPTFEVTTASDEVGAYRFKSLPPGEYAVEIAAPGFAMMKTKAVLVAGAAARVDGRLEVGGVTENLTVTGSRTSAAPRPAGVPQRIKVGGNVQSARLVRQPRPVYPPLAKQARISGVVKLGAIISKDGTIQHLEVISGHPLLVPAALEAVKQWVYQPTLLNGEPVEVQTQIDVNFTLSQ